MTPRKRLRLDGFDYTSARAYFVTLCVQHREARLACAGAGRWRLTGEGETVAAAWRCLGTHHEAALRLDAWVAMPDHFHALLWLTDAAAKPLGRYIGAFKTVSTRLVNDAAGTPGARLWQRSFYDTIVRSDAHLDTVRAYIRDNPARWIERHGVFRPSRGDGPFGDDRTRRFRDDAAGSAV